MPFPREETTPPVTKMYLVAFGPEVIGLPLKCVPMGFRPSKVVAGVDARQGRLGQLGRARRRRHPAGQRVARIRVDPDVLPIQVVAGLPRVTTERDRRSREVQ